MRKVILYATVLVEVELKEGATVHDAVENIAYDFNLDPDYGKVKNNDLQYIETA